MNHTAELARQARNGDAHAFAQLYALIYKDMYRFALYTLGHSQDAEDAVSETVVDAFARIHSLREPEAFPAWMFRILTAKCKRRMRQYMNRTEEIPESLSIREPDEAERLDVRRAFEALPQEDRLILSMNLFAGYSSQEIGELLGMNPNTVRSRQSRALKKIEAQIS